MSSLRLFEPGEAINVAVAQADARRQSWSAREAPSSGATVEAGAPPSDAWAYPPELGGSTGGGPSLAEDEAVLPVDPLLPEVPRERRGPYSVSLIVHGIVIALVIARASWLAAHLDASPSPSDPGLLVALQEPQPEPAPKKPPIHAPTIPKAAHPAPEPETRQAQALTPPPVPKELPPQTPLPAPTRMGELVPVPHYPVPGTVPPEETKTGKVGAPGEKAPPPVPAGSPNGTNDTDPGAGSLKGPGSPGSGDEPAREGGLITEKFLGGLNIQSHRQPGRGHSGAGDSEGGGSRRGMDMRVPGGDLGDFSFEDKDYDWNDYYSQMYYAILRAWYNRLYLTTSNFERWSFQHNNRALNGKVLIRFVIERSGAVSSIEVLEPSVMPPLDDSAKSALKEVILPRLPADFPKEREAVTGRFIMEVDDLGYFKQGLAYQKGKGEF